MDDVGYWQRSHRTGITGHALEFLCWSLSGWTTTVRLGDYIKLESGEEGFVVERGWRSTRIKALSNNSIVVPNAKLASPIVTNFSLPDPHMSLLIPVSVNLSSDPDEVERVLVEEPSKALETVPGFFASRHPSFDSFPVSGTPHSISRSFVALASTLISIWSSTSCESVSTNGFVTRVLNSLSHNGMCMFLRTPPMRFRFPRLVLGNCSEGVGDNTTRISFLSRIGSDQGPKTCNNQFLCVPLADCQCRLVSMSSSEMPLCHGRGRGFESRRPAIYFNELPGVTPKPPTHNPTHSFY